LGGEQVGMPAGDGQVNADEQENHGVNPLGGRADEFGAPYGGQRKRPEDDGQQNNAGMGV